MSYSPMAFTTATAGRAGFVRLGSGIGGQADGTIVSNATLLGLTASSVGLGNVTNESKATMFNNPTFTGTVNGIGASMVGLGNVTNESKATMFTDPTFTGTTRLQQTLETIRNYGGATGVVDHDFTEAAIYYHTSPAGNFTPNFINLPTTDLKSISVTFVIIQGSTAYMPTALQIAGSSQTIKWQGGSAPSGNANKVDVVSFTFFRYLSNWATVIGSLNTYG